MLDYARLRTLLEPFGRLRPQPAIDWTGTDPLPEAIARFYEQVGPWGETHHESVGPVGCTLTVGGNPVCIPPLHKLGSLQAGYAWSSDPTDRLPGWDENWLVFAEQGGDPFILEKSSGNVLFAFHGTGSWQPRIFAEDLVTAIGAIAAVANGFISLEETDFVDEEPTDAALARIRNGLIAVVGDRAQADRALSAWEYYSY